MADVLVNLVTGKVIDVVDADVTVVPEACTEYKRAENLTTEEWLKVVRSLHARLASYDRYHRDAWQGADY